nr:sugar ABC transporter ATP-binding protein [Aquiluna sp.]
MQGSVEMNQITMAFGANLVLKGVDLTVKGGGVTALLGANGAGKSTLIKVLSGLYPNHGGQIIIDGKPVRLETPSDAKKLGIQTVHQRISEGVVPGLSVAENLLFEKIARNALGRVGSIRQIMPKALEVAESLKLGWSEKFLRQDVYGLGIADQQLLILARALIEKPKLLILDEPTSALSAAEVDNLMNVIRSMRDNGVGILYVSHRLGEIDTIADKLVVLRDGVIRGEQDKPFEWNTALGQMLGEDTLQEIQSNIETRGDESILEINDLSLFQRSRPFSLNIRKGEVTGVIGLLGSGKTEIAESIFGAKKKRSGHMTFEGQVFRPRHPRDAIRMGVFMIPEDRASSSMFPNWSIAKTTSLPFLSQLSKGPNVGVVAEKRRASEIISELQIVAEGADQEVDSLSGGNQQKVVVGRWLKGKPKLLILDEPFRGVDIGARRTISLQARELSKSGAGVLVLTSEVDELLEIADRVIVLVDGEPKLDKYLSETSREEIVHEMSEVI